MYVLCGVREPDRPIRTDQEAGRGGEGARLQRERIELSQSVHDTTAQTVYIIGLGIDRARRQADGSDEEMSAALDATSALSKWAMWELRRPIDAGRIFEGRELGPALRDFRENHGRSRRDVADRRRAAARHGDPGPSLLDSAQCACQRVPACPARTGRGPPGLRPVRYRYSSPKTSAAMMEALDPAGNPA